MVEVDQDFHPPSPSHEIPRCSHRGLIGGLPQAVWLGDPRDSGLEKPDWIADIEPI